MIVARALAALLVVVSLRPAEAADTEKLTAAEQLLVAKMADLENVFVALTQGDPGPAMAYVDAIGPDADPVTHLVAGNFRFAFGEFDRAYGHHVTAMAEKALLPIAAWEAVVDLLAMRRFPEACQRLEQVPGDRLVGPETEAVYADLLLRCGQPQRARSILMDLRADRHSSAEEALASVFGEQRRFSVYRFRLDRRRKEAREDRAAHRALGELLVCGDFSNPWQPRRHNEEAVRVFDELGGCAGTGRAALAEILDAEYGSAGRRTVEGLKPTTSRLAPFLVDGPACVEVAEAHYVYLDSVRREDAAAIRAALTQAADRFPDAPVFARLLLDLDRVEGTEAANTTRLKQALERWPEDWFAYSRLAALELTKGDSAGAAAWLKRGLGRVPDSLPLNYLLGTLYLTEARFDEATRIASRYLAGLLETKVRHHDWDTGLAMLGHALDKRSPWPDPARAREQLVGLFRKPAVHNAAFRADHGCFSSGGASVASIPEWFKPREIVAAVDKHRSD